MAFIDDPQSRPEVEKVSRRLKLPVWKSICKGEFRKWWNEWWDKIDVFAETIEGRQINTGTGLKGGGDLTANRTLTLKPATSTEIGGVKQGKNITIAEDGTINGNPTYTHPDTPGNKHLPAGGALNQVIKWASDGTGKWEQVKYEEILGTPTSLKNPHSLKLQLNGKNEVGYDGSQEKTVNITPSSIGAAETNHKHSPSEFDTYSKKEIDDKLGGKANTNHGNHVPTTQTASNKVFLRNDNTWQTVTPANIGAEPAFTKKTGFNKDLGTSDGTVLEGSNLAKILGKNYGGILNNSNTKTTANIYYDNTTKKFYDCIKNNSLNYADAGSYEALSNIDLLGKLKNFNRYSETILFNKSIFGGNVVISQPYTNFQALLVECRMDDNTRGEWCFIPVSTIQLNQKTRLGGDSVYWNGKWVNTTTFNTAEENSVIAKIIGINF